MSDFDSPWKEALEAYFQAFMAFFFPAAHAGIDWSRGHELLDKELQQVVREAEVGRRVVDKLVRVWRNDGEEEWVLVQVEVQSSEEPDFARRMYVYNYRLFDRYNRTVVSLAVLGDERAGWRPEQFGFILWGCSLDFRFPAVKLLDYAADVQALERQTNPFAVMVLAHLKTLETRGDAGTRREWKFRLVRMLYERGWSAEDVVRLFRFVDWMMDLPADLEEGFWQELHRYEEEKRMSYVTSVERRAQEKGRAEGLHDGIRVSITIKFGTAGAALLDEIARISDVNVLQAVLQAIEGARSPDDVRKLWMSESAAGGSEP